MNAEYRGRGISIAFAIRSVDPLPHIIQECPAADSQAQYTAKPILPLVLAELNSYPKLISCALRIIPHPHSSHLIGGIRVCPDPNAEVVSHRLCMWLNFNMPPTGQIEVSTRWQPAVLVASIRQMAAAPLYAQMSCQNIVWRSRPEFRTGLTRSINLETGNDAVGIQYIRRDAGPQVKSGDLRIRCQIPIAMFIGEMAFIHIAEMI